MKRQLRDLAAPGFIVLVAVAASWLMNGCTDDATPQEATLPVELSDPFPSPTEPTATTEPTAPPAATSTPAPSVTPLPPTPTPTPTHINPLPELPSPDPSALSHAYAVEIPEHLRVAAIEAIDSNALNPVTDAGATLGRVLFYDRRLSVNGATSCSSCHLQQHGFRDPRVVSVGFDGNETRRNSMPLLNLRFNPTGRMLWDHRVETIEDQALLPIQSEIEMGMTLPALTDRLTLTDYYPPLFEAAFGNAEITPERVSMALGQFVRSIVSFNSRFDEGVIAAGGVAGRFPNFTDAEQLGKELFFGENGVRVRGSCSTCHMHANPLGAVPPAGSPGAPPPGSPPRENLGILQTGFIVNNGLFDDDDAGLAEVTGNERDVNLFKSPGLRNVVLTAPYMHDGRFATIEEVIDHYSSGIARHPNLNPQLFSFAPGDIRAPLRFAFSDDEKQAMIAFLRTLTDETVLTEPRWSDPFGPAQNGKTPSTFDDDDS